MKKTHFYKMEKSCTKLNLPCQLLLQARWSWRRRLCCVLRWCRIPVLIHRSPGQSPPPGPTRCSTGTKQWLSVKRDQIKRTVFGFMVETCLIEESPHCDISGKHLWSLVSLRICVRPSSTASYILFYLQWVNMENDIITLKLINQLCLIFFNIMCDE